MTSGNISSNHPRSGYINDKNHITLYSPCIAKPSVRHPDLILSKTLSTFHSYAAVYELKSGPLQISDEGPLLGTSNSNQGRSQP